MHALGRTERAFAENYLALSNFSGEHLATRQIYGLENDPIGYSEFDPTVHKREAVDLFSFATLASGIDHVAITHEQKSLNLNIVLDGTFRRDTVATTASKHLAAISIAEMLEASLPEPSDLAFLHLVRSFSLVQRQKLHRKPDEERIVDSTPAFMGVASEIAASGLTVVISDFERMRFPDKSLSPAVAVKVNDVSETKVLPGQKPLSLGEEYELDRTDPTQVSRMNGLIGTHHQKITDGLKNAGAVVVEVTAGTSDKFGFDAGGFDGQMAEAISQISR